MKLLFKSVSEDSGYQNNSRFNFISHIAVFYHLLTGKQDDQM